jgi:hypothetical protein
MATLEDINKQRDAALNTLDGKIMAANDLANAGAVGLDATINDLTQQKADLAAQAYAGALTDAAFVAALTAIKAATQDLTRVAARMTTATSYIVNVGSLGAAVNHVITALTPAA